VDDLGIRQQRADQGRHRRCAEQQGFADAAGVQGAVGEHMAAVEIDRRPGFRRWRRNRRGTSSGIASTVHTQ
jgi:hypothetical protein